MEKSLLRYGPLDAGAKVSTEEFATAEFVEPYRYERVKGRLVVMAPAGPEHQEVSRPFRKSLAFFWAEHEDLIDDIIQEGWVSTSEDDDRIPDLCVYLRGASAQPRIPERVPDLIFEFVSRSRADQERDYIAKREEYHRIGVREYVIVDRFKERVLVLTWQPAEYAERELLADDHYTSPLLPGLRVVLREAFASEES